jgi:oligosaccharide repeat unit polymerase
MIIILFFSAYILLLKNKTSVATMLAVFVILSSIFGVVIGRVPDLSRYIDLFHVAFTITILLIFINSFKNYRLYRIRELKNKKSLKFILFIVLWCSIIALLLNSYIVYKSFTYVFLNSISITEYKNQGGANELIRIWVDPFLVSIVNILSPLGYIALSFHFYFLVKNRLWMSIIFLLLALNIPLQGLHGLSRSASAQFIFTYVFFYLYIYRAIARKVRIKINIVALTIMTLVIVAFGVITEARFSESDFYQVEKDVLVQNKTLYSMFDYFSQWNENGIAIMGEFSHDKLWFGKSSRPALDRVINSLGVDLDSYVDMRKDTLGPYSSKFNGLVATLLYDFGYIFTFILSLVYFLIVRNVGPRNGEISLSNFLFFSVLFPVPLMFFGNNSMAYLSLNLGLIYTFVVWIVLRARSIC